MRIARMRWRLTAAGLSSLAAIVVLGGDNGSPVRALAPLEIAASGFEALSGVAVDAGGAILVTDREAGTLTRIDAAGRRRVLLDALHGPTGVAIDQAGGVLVIEQGGRRLLRLASDGVLTIVASGLRQARSVAVGPDGRVWLSMRRAVGRHRDDDGDDEDHGLGSEFVIARVDQSGTLTPFASGLMGVQGLAAGEGALYVVMARLATERGRLRTTLARIPVRANGSAGLVQPLLRNSRHRPRGVTIDAAGDVFVAGSAKDDDEDDDGKSAGVILKRRADGRVSTFATGLRDPVAVAFAPNGDLVAVEKDEPGRVLRFRAPLPPTLAAPAFTNQTPLALDGRAAAGARVTVGRAETPGPPLAFTVADSITGTFLLQVPLAPNAMNRLSAVATGAGGAGLVSRPTTAEIVHDDVPPSLTIIEPVSGVHTRGPILSSARAEDERSGVAGLLWSVDGTGMAHLENPTPEEPFAAGVTLATAALAEGTHAVEVAAVDRASNRTVGAVPMVVDRTPPETVIVSGPAAEIPERTTTFTVSGTDVWSAPEQLDYAWRLDEGRWSPFDALAVITLSDLAPGEHRFEVTARDRAGNEDATPAVQTFTVRSLRVRILEPVDGTVVTAESVWVRGTVESGGREVSVTISLPPELRAELPLDVLAAATEAGTFAVEVPVTSSTTTLSVTAVDETGATARDEVAVSVQPPLSALNKGFEAFPSAGLAPHTVNFGVPAGEGVRLALDLESDGTVDFEGATLTDREFVYTGPGVYVATLRVTTEDGQVSESRTAVEVYDRIVLNRRLQAAWRNFKDALRTGDVERAVTFIHSNRRARWQEYFSQFTPGLFTATDIVFTDMTLLDVGAGSAECEMMREVDGLLYSFPISFLIDVDGRWRLWQF